VALISVHPYSLQPRGAPNRLASAAPRRGLLVRWEADGRAGHADLFPWPELGDADIDQLRADLRQQVTNALTRAALEWARYEAQAQVDERAFFPAPDVASHVTLLPGVSTNAPLAKAKISTPDPQEAVEILDRSPHTQFRFDLNGLFCDPDAAMHWWSFLAPYHARIDFLEDPTALTHLASARTWFPGAKIALDRCDDPALWKLADVLVLKPSAARPASAPSFAGPLVVTSVMGHPLGQLQALHAAQRWRGEGARIVQAGLLTHDCYLPHAQSDWVTAADGCLRPTRPEGPGWGLNAPLNSLRWEAP